MHLDDVDELKDDITTTEFMAKHLTDKIIQELDNLKYPVKKLYSVGIILKENHLASATYTKLI